MDFKAFKYLLFNNFIDYSRIVKIIFAYQIFDLIEFYFITGYCFEIIMIFLFLFIDFNYQLKFNIWVKNYFIPMNVIFISIYFLIESFISSFIK